MVKLVLLFFPGPYFETNPCIVVSDMFDCSSVFSGVETTNQSRTNCVYC